MQVLKGNPVSPGVAKGRVYLYRPFEGTVQPAFCDEAGCPDEKARLEAALVEAGWELDAVMEALSTHDADRAKIFAAHREILEDEEIVEAAMLGVLEMGRTAEYAVFEAFEEFIRLIAGAKDAVIASRVADFADVRNRVLRILQGVPEQNLSSLPSPVVVVARDLAPSDTATLDRQNVLGIITETGGATSHTAILANSYGIPAVVGVRGVTAALADGQEVALDALAGEVLAEPDEKACQALEEKRVAWKQKRALEAQYLDRPACMADGVMLQIGLNIGGEEPAECYCHCDFVGLFRTEFLYMDGDHAPTEEEQYTAYSQVMERAAGRPVTLRTLDIGGDKTLPYMALPKEDNPFLGKRALRLCLAEPALFRTQLRAALRASALGEMWVMIPMVGSLEDIRRARAVYDEVWAQLVAEGMPPGGSTKFGIMVEIPAITMVAELAAEEVDFASIGTNDLCQYLCAVDRMNPELDAYYQTFSPAMVRVLGQVIEAFTQAGKPVSVCGEMAGDPRGAVLLAGLGLTKLSMSAAKMAGVKAALAKVRLADARRVAHKAARAKTEGEVIELAEAALA